MKEFDLEKALAGRPVILKNGCKGFIIAEYPTNEFGYPLIGYWITKEGVKLENFWNRALKSQGGECNRHFDIVGMWEDEPKERNKNAINQIENWFKTAMPDQTDGNKLVQIGCHLEEVCEMLDVFGSFTAGEELNELSGDFKKRRGYYDCAKLSDKSKIELLDALCDQIVTAIGVAYMFGMDIQGALKEVADSNDSKFENGGPVFDGQGKIAKGKHYFTPNLKRFI